MNENESAYCDYNDSFPVYDRIRTPHASGEILEILRRESIPPKGMRLLDGGYGTGLHMEFFSSHVKEVHGIEGSSAGYQETRRKLQGVANAYPRRGNILHLPFADDFFDAYLVNQVLHHLDWDPEFPGLDAFLKEAKRTLRPGGILIVNTCSQEQLDPETGSFWFYRYIEKGAREMKKRYIPLEELVARLEKEGFTDLKRTIPEERIFTDRVYEDPRIALEESFIKGDSAFSFLSELELKEFRNTLETALQDGSVYDIMKYAEKRGEEIGETVILTARLHAS